MARTYDDLDKMIAAAAANPVGARLLELIHATSTAAGLNHISEHEIPDADGISEQERDALQEAVNLRFCALNAAAMSHQDKPRWDI
ncbi:MAG TPA: hypothetical protein VK811_08100 [Candidatus Acidoferrum sp.]|jgi:hypothetical protein|nr:hypothetical protein [Candidatus Acidoferrum sp.]